VDRGQKPTIGRVSIELTVSFEPERSRDTQGCGSPMSRYSIAARQQDNHGVELEAGKH
jgi:hypothetical protein